MKKTLTYTERSKLRAVQVVPQGATPGPHTHPQSDITNLTSDLALKAPLASPALTGTPTAPTAAPGTNTTQIATTAFVQAASGIADGDKGDITVSGSGVTWTIDNGVVSLAKMANMATDSLLGRDTAGSGAPEVLSPATVRTILNVADGANNYVHPNHTGDVTSVADGAQTIANDAVTYAKMQNVSAASKLLGRGDSGSGDPQEITLGSGLSMTGTTLAATGGGGGGSPLMGWFV